MRNSPESLLEDDFDKVLEHRTRLAICVLLSRNDEMSFRRFKDLLNETDGNLGAQLKKLEDNEYVSVRKEFADRKPVSWYTLTKKGKTALQKHVAALEKMIASLK